MLTWAVVPIMQGYAISGAFTVLGRVRSSLKRLWVFYLVIGALAAAVRRPRGAPHACALLAQCGSSWVGWRACCRRYAAAACARDSMQNMPLGRGPAACPPAPQGVLAALAAGKLKVATLPALVFTLSNTYGAGSCCSLLDLQPGRLGVGHARDAGARVQRAPCTPPCLDACIRTTLPHQV